MPDMVVLDSEGRLWIGTDGMSKATSHRRPLRRRYGRADAGTSKLFFRCPVGTEL